MTVVHQQVTGWAGGPGECGAECACGTTFDGFDTITEAVAMLDQHIADANERAEYVAGLRALADVLEQHPDLDLPYDGSKTGLLVLPSRGSQREQLAGWARALHGVKRKAVRGDAFDLHGQLRGLNIQVIADRDEVCERVVLGTREVVEEVPDPDALALVPKVVVTKVIEDVEWLCKSILDGAR